MYKAFKPYSTWKNVKYIVKGIVVHAGTHYTRNLKERDIKSLKIIMECNYRKPMF